MTYTFLLFISLRNKAFYFWLMGLLLPILGVSLLCSILILVEFTRFIVKGKRWLKGLTLSVIEAITLVIIPLIFLVDDAGHMNVDNEDIAVFAPAHRLTLYSLITLCVIAYYYSKVRKSIKPPLIEIITNCFLLMGVVLNAFIIYHISKLDPPGVAEEDDIFLAILYNVPIIMLFIMRIAQNHVLFMQELANYDGKGNFVSKTCYYILKMKPLQKFPILLVLCLPVLVLMAMFLLLFGQKPDSMIEMFTQTYNQGFSQLDPATLPWHDDHFLCTIGSKGHKNLVKPERIGIRRGRKIIVTRQLLISNAFEELLEQKAPFIHNPARRAYNFLGGNCAKLYEILGNKWVSDFVYISFKPVEWFFLMFLYTFDRKPEDRIAKQYLSVDDRKRIG